MPFASKIIYAGNEVSDTNRLPVDAELAVGDITLDTEGLATDAHQVTEHTRLGALTETAPASDTASSGLNGRLQRVAQNLTSLIGLYPASLGQKTKAGSFAVTLASDEDLLTRQGSLTETAPATDTASSGINGRLQRIAQRLGSMIALLPTSLGQKVKAGSLAVTLASDEDLLTRQGALTETAPATDTASSGINGRLQRIAQRLTSVIALLPSSIGQKAKTDSLSVTLASNDDALALLAAQVALLGPEGAHVDGTAISTAQTLTPEAGSTHLLIQAIGQNIRLTLDGTTPTATKGFRLVADDPPLLIPLGTGISIKVIEEAATADVQYQWLN